MAGSEEPTELERKLAEVDQLRRRVLNVLPHALRTPITTFRGLAEALPNATEEQIRRDIAPALRRLAAQAEHLLDDMLVAAGYTTALPTGPKVATPVASTVVAVWADVGGDRRLHQIEVDPNLQVKAATGALHKMFVHLLDNAAKYGQEPSVRAVADNGKVTIEVKTKGPQLPDVGMFTEPFYRGEAAVTMTSGVGVGLTVARALAEQAGGSLEVRGADGGGLVAELVLETA
ncbi:MAG: two-component system, OmpR family, phosphate regulon sensor histidine kinase PhoR [Actinomycetota bacterium]|nr:two-component system, OmpR family, phosphate regulon sensor histidine kinase PhoR [Actinomycetota bacterium]